IVVLTEKPVDFPCGMVSLFYSPGIACSFVDGCAEHQTPWGNQCHKEILVHRKFVLTSDEKSQSRVKPGRHRCRQQCDILDIIIDRVVAPWYFRTGSPTAGNAGGDAFIKCRGHQ